MKRKTTSNPAEIGYISQLLNQLKWTPSARSLPVELRQKLGEIMTAERVGVIHDASFSYTTNGKRERSPQILKKT